MSVLSTLRLSTGPPTRSEATRAMSAPFLTPGSIKVGKARKYSASAGNKQIDGLNIYIHHDKWPKYMMLN